VITASTVMGGTDVYVNAHTRVIVDGFAIMGSFEQGHVTVRRRPQSGESRRRMLPC
jgi:hypothetical protein